MVFQGLDRSEAQAVWQPFLDSLAAAPDDFEIEFSPLKIVVDLGPQLLGPDAVQEAARLHQHRRPARRAAGQCVLAGRSGAGRPGAAWLPVGLAAGGAAARGPAAGARRRAVRRDAGTGACRCTSTRAWQARRPRRWPRRRDTAMNPAVLDAFALVICGAEGPPAYPGVAGHEPDPAAGTPARAGHRARDGRAAQAGARTPAPTSSESNFFEPDWQRSFWGSNYPRLLAVKQRYDPDGLFFVHHGVGSERWSADGFSAGLNGGVSSGLGGVHGRRLANAARTCAAARAPWNIASSNTE